MTYSKYTIYGLDQIIRYLEENSPEYSILSVHLDPTNYPEGIPGDMLSRFYELISRNTHTRILRLGSIDFYVTDLLIEALSKNKTLTDVHFYGTVSLEFKEKIKEILTRNMQLALSKRPLEIDSSPSVDHGFAPGEELNQHAVTFAIKEGNTALLHAFIKAYPSCLLQKIIEKSNFVEAAQNAQFSCLQYLAQYDEFAHNQEALDDALFSAVENADLLLAKYLLDMGASPSALKNGHTVITHAGSSQLIKLLLDYEADANAKVLDSAEPHTIGFNVLQSFFFNRQSVLSDETLTMLKDAGADINNVSSDNKTLLHTLVFGATYVQEKRFLENLCWLFRAVKVDAFARDKNRKTAYQYSRVTSNNHQILESLLVSYISIRKISLVLAQSKRTGGNFKEVPDLICHKIASLAVDSDSLDNITAKAIASHNFCKV